MAVPSATTDERMHYPQKPRRTEYQGTYPISREDKIKLDLWMSTRYEVLPEPSSNEADEMGVVPSFPYRDVPIYGDTADIMALYFRGVWGCLLTPKNVGDLADTTGIRYHVWVATKKVLERYPESSKTFYMRLVLRQFLFELGLAMLGVVKGPVVIFIDPRLHDSKAAMVYEARALVELFDRADVRRWRVIITLPATDDGIRAARELTNRYSISIHLSVVTSLAHARACIEAGATMLSMNIAPIMTWFEKKDEVEVEHPIAPDHPGIKTIQSCIDYIHQNSLNTSLLVTDIRDWDELKQLGGIGAVALSQQLLDQISMLGLTTWFPEILEECDDPPVCQYSKYPFDFRNHERGLGMTLSAGDRSIMSSVVYIHLGRNKVFMQKIEDDIRKEVDERLYVDAFDPLSTTLYGQESIGWRTHEQD
ncbi:aldolase [Suillus hirtellus]|nr:aldolase [Suillus hirtellus]